MADATEIAAYYLGRLVSPLKYLNVRHPSLLEISSSSELVTTDPLELASRLVPMSQELMVRMKQEVSELTEALEARRKSVVLEFPAYFGVTDRTAEMLYQLVRVSRPDTIVETGVADGVSSFAILRALNVNGSGHLYSFDVRPRVGGLVEPNQRSRWTLSISKRDNSGKTIAKKLDSFERVDLFLHDSYHWYVTQLTELSAALRRSSHSAFIICDDADASYAFLDFVRAAQMRSFALLTTRKVVGVAVRIERIAPTTDTVIPWTNG